MDLADENLADRADLVGVDACNLSDLPILAVGSLDDVVTDVVSLGHSDGVRGVLLTWLQKHPGILGGKIS